MNVDESIDYLLKIVIKKLEDYEKNVPIKTEKSINILTKNKHKKINILLYLYIIQCLGLFLDIK